MRFQRTGGFTLIEAVVASAVLAVIALLGSQLFLTAAQQGKQLGVQADFLTQVSTAMSQIRRDLRNASASVPRSWPGAAPAPSQTYQPMVAYSSASASLNPPLIPNGAAPYASNEVHAGTVATTAGWTVPATTAAGSATSLGNPNLGVQVGSGVYRGDTLYFWPPTGFATAGPNVDTVLWGNGPVVYMFVPLTSPTPSSPATATNVFTFTSTTSNGVTFTNLGNPYAGGVNSVGQGPNVPISPLLFPNGKGLFWSTLAAQPSYLKALYNYHDASHAAGTQPLRIFELVRIDFNTLIPDPSSSAGALMANPNCGRPVLLVPQIENWPYATTSAGSASADYPYFEVDTTASPGIKVTVCFRVVTGIHEAGATDWRLYSQGFCESFTLQP